MFLGHGRIIKTDVPRMNGKNIIYSRNKSDLAQVLILCFFLVAASSYCMVFCPFACVSTYQSICPPVDVCATFGAQTWIIFFSDFGAFLKTIKGQKWIWLILPAAICESCIHLLHFNVNIHIIHILVHHYFSSLLGNMEPEVVISTTNSILLSSSPLKFQRYLPSYLVRQWQDAFLFQNHPT